MTASFLDCSYSCILLPHIQTETDLQGEVITIADRMYDQRNSDLSNLYGGKCPSRERWRRRVQKLVMHPEYYGDGTVVAVRALGSAEKPRHATIAEWIAIELLRHAPKGYKTPFSVVTNAPEQAPGSYGWVMLDSTGESLMPADLTTATAA